MRPELVAKGKDMVLRKRYFTIWAPRQTGKSTYFLLLKEELEQEGYKVIQMNLENYLGASLTGLIRSIKWEFDRIGNPLPKLSSFDDFSLAIKSMSDFKLVLIVDEVEGLNPSLFGQFLHSIRNLYHSRQEHCLKSVIFVGVSNIVGVVQDNASPFNIADNINVPYFTDTETVELLGQHESETGQLFDQKTKENICHITANQPGLVNSFAWQLVDRYPAKPILTLEDYLVVEDWFLRHAIDKNVANIINKANEYRQFVEGLLFTDIQIPFEIERPAIKFLHTNGLINDDGEGYVTFWVPLYKKRLFKAFYPYTNGERNTIASTLDIWNYFLPDGNLNIPKTIENYKAYVKRRSFKYFREKFKNGKYKSIKEAALVYSFETYLQAFLSEAGGHSYLEPHTGTGRCDLLINLNDHEYVIEAKVYRRPSQFEKGKRQLAKYCADLGLTEGYYLVFVPNHIDLVHMRIEEKPETFQGVLVHTWLVIYDEEKDFK